MKTKIKNRIIASILGVIAALFVFSCSKWTEVEGVGVENPNISEQDPELYAAYLKNLRCYKDSDHKTVYAWFNNSEKVPYTRAQHLKELPDSIDVVVLMQPSNLASFELQEIASIRQDKGTKVIAPISYEGIKRAYDLMVSDKLEQDPTYTPTDFVTVLGEKMEQIYQDVEKYNYDGICFSFNGKGTLHLDPDELTQYNTYTGAFIKLVEKWNASKGEKILVFEGKPQNLIDKSFLTDCEIIFLPAADATNRYEFTYITEMAAVEGVPTDRFAVSVSTTSLDETDTKTGYFTDNTRAIANAAQWSSAIYKDYTISGLGIYHVSNDYYNTLLIYEHTRDAISTLNPPIKN